MKHVLIIVEENRFDLAYTCWLLYNPRQIVGVLVKFKHGIQDPQRLLLLQAGITMLLGLGAGLYGGYMPAVSAVLGGLNCLLPNVCLVVVMFRHRGANRAKLIVNSFYKGEAGKLALTVIMFALVFKYTTIIPMVFFSVYIMVQMGFWFAPLIVENNRNRPESD